jgi:hypothetical protein
MKHRIVGSAFTLTMLLTLSMQASLGQDGGMRVDRSISKRQFTVVPYKGPVPCHPVEVKAASIGTEPLEVVTAQVNIESFSAKPVTAVKLAWNVYKMNAGLRKRVSGCEENPKAAETLLSGSTPLIQVGQLAEKETLNIGINPMPYNYPATKTVFVEQPIVAWDAVKSLTNDGTRDTFKEDYALVMYISEIHFADGTKWTGEIK